MITVTMLVPLAILLLSNYILAYDGEPRHYFDLEVAEDYFSWFVDKYNKTYTKHETKMRFEIFKENLKTVNEDNLGLRSPVFGITQFSDLTLQEFKQKYIGPDIKYGLSLDSKKNKLNVTKLRDDVPVNFDWRDRNVVTSVKNQLDCKSHWAMCTAASIESLYAMKTGKLVDLSPQQLVDCYGGESGCKGDDTVEGAIMHLIMYGGIEKEIDYKYTGKEGKCKFDESMVEIKISGYKAISMPERISAEFIFRGGPLCIAVDATRFHTYHSGILQNCKPGIPNHYALLVGYGSDDGFDYWIVKNSWGETFGEKGYIRLERGVNACGLANNRFEGPKLED